MGLKTKRKARRGGGRRSKLTGKGRELLGRALAAINPAPTNSNWKALVSAVGKDYRLQSYTDGLLAQNPQLDREWAALWVAHGASCMQGQVEFANDLYAILIENYPRDYYTEFQRGRFCREYLAEYFDARAHLRFAVALYPDGIDAYFQLGLLYDLLGMPEYAFQFEEQAYQKAKEAGSELYKLRAHLSFNQAVAMWQASRPYGDIKAYLNRALDEWPEYERASNFLESLPEDNDLDPRGRYSMQRFTDDVKQNRPAFQIIDPD